MFERQLQPDKVSHKEVAMQRLSSGRVRLD